MIKNNITYLEVFFLWMFILFHSVLFADTAKNTSRLVDSKPVSLKPVVSPSTDSKPISSNKQKTNKQEAKQKPLIKELSLKKKLLKQKKSVTNKKNLIPARLKRALSSDHGLSKEDLLGDTYYSFFESKEIEEVINPLVDKISNLCQHKTLKERVIDFQKTLGQLKKNISMFLGKHNLHTKDQVYLLSIQSHVVDIFFPLDKKMFENINTQQTLPASRFLHNYQSAYNLESEGTPFFYHPWARKIWTGLKCIEKNTLNNDDKKVVNNTSKNI